VNWLQKIANGNLQTEIETNEYSSSKNYSSSLLVVYYSSSTRVLAAALPIRPLSVCPVCDVSVL